MSKESKKEETVREIISVKNLYKLYRVGDSVVRALDGVSFSVYEGEFCAIVGTSGSGKSTLLNMLAGLEKPTRGEVIVAGKHIEQMKENELVKFRGENVGFIFQSFHLMGTMNALENVALPLTFRGEPRKERIKKADRMLDLVSLEKHKKHLPNQLSGGQQQRVSVARALVNDPKIIFAQTELLFFITTVFSTASSLYTSLYRNFHSLPHLPVFRVQRPYLRVLRLPDRYQ